MDEEKVIPSQYNIVEGYFVDGNFYSDKECTHELIKKSMTVYVDLPTLNKYQWSWSKYCYTELTFATHLLPIGKNSPISTKYRQMNVTGTVTNSLSYEHNRMLYIGTFLDNSILRIQKLNLMTNDLSILADIPKASIGKNYIGGMVVDDDYIYLTTSVNGNDSYRTLYRVNLDTLVIDSFTAPRNFQCYGKIMKYDDHTLVLSNQYGLLFFDTLKCNWSQQVDTSYNQGSREEMSVGKKLVITHHFSTSKISPVKWNNETKLFKNITLSSDGVSISCYDEDNAKFYIAQTNYLYMYDEETESIEKTFSIPWTNPKTINYSNGILFVTQKNSPKLFVYDIKNDMYSVIILPWTIPNISSSGITRPTVFKGYFLIPYLTLGIINYSDIAKYNLGYKFDQYIFIFNDEEKESYNYDDKFIEFTDSYLTIHDGSINKQLTTIDTKNNIKTVSIDKSSYNKIKNISYISNRNNNEEGM